MKRMLFPIVATSVVLAACGAAASGSSSSSSSNAGGMQTVTIANPAAQAGTAVGGDDVNRVNLPAPRPGSGTTSSFSRSAATGPSISQAAQSPATATVPGDRCTAGVGGQSAAARGTFPGKVQLPACMPN